MYMSSPAPLIYVAKMRLQLINDDGCQERELGCSWPTCEKPFSPSKAVGGKYFNNSVRTFYIMEMIISRQRVRDLISFFFLFP